MGKEEEGTFCALACIDWFACTPVFKIIPLQTQ